ncbi:metalloregulator ArsR/SmtB family transcription factor [Sandaracinobacter sp. RS1-74]|uniref:ArsR/SmtB family transcription factor n=1 Tax=Sandaracinobacteroides sayramensis TaxID=2913411 RepID=UPI001EDA3E84|nr:metalloregulator ArsR/SmtB family transcription factor [Sandaracinobacteroides sayramensis]
MTAAHDIFAALADPTRVKILLLVRDLQLSIGELADLLDQSQPRVSRHVRILAEAGLVRRQKEGAWVFVGLGEAALAADLADLAVRAQPGADPIAAERARLGQVRSERQRVVDEWFEANAGEWDLLRRMGGQDEAVEATLLESASSPAIGRLLDIGTGTGRLLELLAPLADGATGVDRSPEMLRLARGKLAAAGNQSADLKQADMRSLPFEDASFDTVTMQQVLHFADDPAPVLAEAARVLAPGGKILVADYAAHGHEELRARYHHARLGFEEEGLLSLLAGAGLRPRLVARHAGPELSVLLWEGRKD